MCSFYAFQLLLACMYCCSTCFSLYYKSHSVYLHVMVPENISLALLCFDGVRYKLPSLLRTKEVFAMLTCVKSLVVTPGKGFSTSSCKYFTIFFCISNFCILVGLFHLNSACMHVPVSVSVSKVVNAED